MTEEPPERATYTEMTKCTVSYIASHSKEKLGEHYLFGRKSRMAYDDKIKVLENIEKELHERVLVLCNPQDTIAWVTSIVARTIMCRLRLMIYHPVEAGTEDTTRPKVPGEHLLETAVEALEYAHLLDTEPSAARWWWFFKTYSQWHPLAVTLVELCVQTDGPLVDRAWQIVDFVYEEQANRVADSAQGGLWRPMKKLMSKAKAKRQQVAFEKNLAAPQQQLPLPQFQSLSFDQLDPSLISPTAASPFATTTNDITNLQPGNEFGQQLPSTLLATAGGEASGEINWAEWDAFMQDAAPSNESDMG